MTAPTPCPFHRSGEPERAALPQEHPPVADQKVGVLLVNLGTPDALDYRSVRRYLSEFLSDRRVIELNPLLWQPILQGPILTFRPKKSARAYAKIWNRELDESPLRTVTRAQSDALAARLSSGELLVDWAMRYGNPSIASRLATLVEGGASRVLIFGLYPQYASSTTATVYDKAFEALTKLRWQPAVRTVPPFHDDPVWIDAIVASIRAHLATLEQQPEVLLTSFHGLPQEYVDKGDPYRCQCAKSARLIGEALGWEADRVRLVFQSRFGPAEWLRPYADQTVVELAKEGVQHLAVVTPGFFADCVETLEEVDLGLRESFLAAGGTSFATVPCLNASRAGIDVLEAIVRRELSGWW
ncbi:MAG: ferrochelatase [Planctomycetota bacterium]